jgi:nucleoside 2-deoxyribosyltransferase
MYFYTASALTYYHKTNQFYKATEWRKIFEQWCKEHNHKLFNPATTFSIEQNHTYKERNCVDQNKYYLDKANVLIVNLDDIMESAGTQWELCYASMVRRIPIIAFGESSWSPHINYGISHQCKDIYEAIELLDLMYSQE